MTFGVVVTRGSGTWLLDVPSLDGAYSAADDIHCLDEHAREVCLRLDEPDEAMAAMEFEWVLDVPERDLVREFGRAWTLADVATALRAPLHRVSHRPPGYGTRLRRWLTSMRLAWRYRRFYFDRDDDGEEVTAGATAM
jgi:hypothetical protein